MAIVPYSSYSIRPLYHKNSISTLFYSSLLTKTESFTFVLFPRRTANTSAFLWNFDEDTVSFSQRTYLFIYSFVPSVFLHSTRNVHRFSLEIDCFHRRWAEFTQLSSSTTQRLSCLWPPMLLSPKWNRPSTQSSTFFLLKWRFSIVFVEPCIPDSIANRWQLFEGWRWIRQLWLHIWLCSHRRTVNVNSFLSCVRVCPVPIDSIEVLRSFILSGSLSLIEEVWRTRKHSFQ